MSLYRPKASNKEIRSSRLKLQDPYAHLNSDGGFDGLRNHGCFQLSPKQIASLTAIQKGRHDNKRISRHRIASIASELRKLIWEHRHQIWPNQIPSNPVDMLDPSIAIGLLGYTYSLEPVGQFEDDGEIIEVAGIIDKESKEIVISNLFSPKVQRFTGAHELAHAILHPTSGLHRDRAVDGSRISTAHHIFEQEANEFASEFLMPERLVRECFAELFYTESFELNEDTRFALGPSLPDKLKKTHASLREISRVLASAEYYDGRPIISLASQFCVSIEAMAIRIEELNLVRI